MFRRYIILKTSVFVEYRLVFEYIGCPNNWLKDGYCDSACNNIECDWDAGDCLDANGTNIGSSGNSNNAGNSGAVVTHMNYALI